MTQLIKHRQLELIRITYRLGIIHPIHILNLFKPFGRGQLGFGQPEFFVVNDMVFLKHAQIFLCELLFRYEKIDVFVEVLAVFFA